MKIYLVWSGEYSDKRVKYVTTDREKAEQYTAFMNNERLAKELEGDWYYLDDYYVEECDTDNFPDMSSTLDLVEKNDMVYGWKFVSSYNHYGKNRTKLGRCYFKKEERNVVTKENKVGGDVYVVHILADSKDLALKIGSDIIAKHRAMIEGIA